LFRAGGLVYEEDRLPIPFVHRLGVSHCYNRLYPCHVHITVITLCNLHTYDGLAGAIARKSSEVAGATRITVAGFQVVDF
jgi:hypothetical protein